MRYRCDGLAFRPIPERPLASGRSGSGSDSVEPLAGTVTWGIFHQNAIPF